MKTLNQVAVMRVLLFSLFFLLLFTGAGTTAPLLGKVTLDGQPATGIVVSAFPVSAYSFKAAEATLSAKTDQAGAFTLDLKPGEYFLLADGEGYYGFYGRNPVVVPEAGLANINLPVLPEKLPVPQGESEIETGVAGLVSIAGEPVEGAVVMVYTDLSSRLKGMGLGWMPPTDATGYFEAPLSAGTYYLVVRVRKSGKMAGPLQAGDLFGYLSVNPLPVREGELVRVHIPLIEVPEKIDQHAASMFGNTLVTGRVVNPRGEPVAGIQVLLYDDPMMLNRPLFVSPRTGTDGRYQLSFPSGGHYYLAARNELGGTPAPGELYGRYQGTADHAIEIETGKLLEGVEIVVDEVF